MAKILIAVPHGGMVEPETLVSVYNMAIPEGVETELKLFYSYGVDIGRNMASRHAIDNGFTHVFFVDADMSIPGNALSALLSRNEQIVSGVYVKKTEAGEIVAMKRSRVPNEFEPVKADEILGQQPIPVEIIGLGCALIRTEVLARMGHPQFKFTDSEDPKKRQGEDIFFCMRASSMYYKVKLDPTVRCGHIGRKKYTI